jgi:hypothetical protein
MNTESQRGVADCDDHDYEQLISSALFWVLLGALAAPCVIVIAVAFGRSLA